MAVDPFTLFDLIGTAAFAYSGYLAGRRHGLDVVGIFIVAMLTATAGGAVADLLLGKTPAVLSNRNAFFLVLAVVAAGAVLTRAGVKPLEDRWPFVITDTVGLIAFAFAGAHKAMDAGMLFFGTVVIAFVSAVGGGIIRDSLTNEVPSVLHSGVYGSVALLAGAMLWLADTMGWGYSANHWVIFFFCIGLRLVSHHRGWSLPKI